MSRQDANAAFALTSFLYGSNAPYIEDLYARYEADPQAVDAEWQSFFQSLKDNAADVEKNAHGPSWARPDWPPLPRGDLVAALDGNWAEVGNGVGIKVKAQAQSRGVELSSADVERATRDSIRALMLIRAYRARGHFHANLDPLGLEPVEERGGARSAHLRLQRGRSRPSDLSRQGARARIRHHPPDRRHPAAHLLPDARRRIFAHLQRRAEGLDPGAHRRAGQGDHRSPAKASAPSSTSWSKPKALKNSAT